MKYNLFCMLIGHTFVQEISTCCDKEGMKIDYVKLDYCVRCGLSKKELGITNECKEMKEARR